MPQTNPQTNKTKRKNNQRLRTPFSSAGWFVSLLNQVGFDHTSIEPFDQMTSTTQVKTVWYNGYRPNTPKQESEKTMWYGS